MQRGKFLKLLIGGMCSNKTAFLILEIDTLRDYGKKTVLVFKPVTDTRSGKGSIKSRRGDEAMAFEIPVEDPWRILAVIREEEKKTGFRADVIAVDEVQFFPVGSGFVELVNELLNLGYDVLAAGLPVNFRGEPFGTTLQLTWWAQDRCDWLESYCAICGSVALFSQRLIDKQPAPYDSEEILIGDQEYEPRCHSHFILPKRPYPPTSQPHEVGA
jgi:thymidine kinase